MSERIYFGKIKEAIEPPNLIEVQLNSYVEFLQKDVSPGRRKNLSLGHPDVSTSGRDDNRRKDERATGR